MPSEGPIERLRGRRVLVTGAASGIGRALATIAIESGAAATLIDLDATRLDALDGVGPCTKVSMDVSDPDAWSALASPAEPWDFVALNAGVMTAPPDAPAEASDLFAMELEDYDRILRVNVDGVVHGVRRVVPELAGDGAIVVTASAAGLVGFAADVPYSMTKHAVVGLVRGVAGLLSRERKGQRICAICPGGVQTGLVPSAFQGMKMMEPSVIAREIASLWLEGGNGDVMVKMRPELSALRVDEPELPPWW